MAKVATVGGVTGVAFLALGLGLPEMIENLPPAVSYGLAAVGLVLLLTAFVWSLLNRGGDGGPPNAQTSHGPNSPVVGSVARDFHYYPPAPLPAARQEPKSPYGSAQIKPQPQRVPRTRMWEALEWVAKVIGDDDHQRCFPDARREIRQAALNARVDIYGRKEIPPAHMTAEESCREVWTQIPSDYWNDWRITEMAAGPLHDERPHTGAEEHIRTGLMSGRYWALRVDAEDLKREWPEPPPSPPKPDLPLNGLLVRIYKALGPSPEGEAAKANFYRKVNFEIGDQVVENGLHVWGRYFERPREIISARALKRGRFDHRKGVFLAPTIDSDPMKYTDLHFNTAEVDKIWPK